jgi:transposase
MGWVGCPRALHARRGDRLAERRARHRVSKLLLVHGRVYPGKTAWNQTHKRWLAQQSFEHEPTELAFVDLLAAVDGLTARREALEERLSRLAQDERLWRADPPAPTSISVPLELRRACAPASADFYFPA